MLTAIVPIYILHFIVYKNGIVEAKITYVTYKEERSRVTPYRSHLISKTCLLKPDQGPCRSEIPMYFYEPSTGNCSTFFWGGCQGNGNRFDTHRECIQSCLSSPNHPKTRPKWCSLSFDYGFCFGALNRWHYDAVWKVCKQRIYSGCGGNKNNFYNQEQCDSICRFGNGAIIKTVVKDKSGLKKILIIDPSNATTKKGRDQMLRSK